MLAKTLHLVALAIVIPLAVLGIIYAASLKRDIDSLRGQNAIILQQLKIQRQISSDQLATSKALLASTQSMLSTSQDTLKVVADSNTKLSQSLVVQTETLRVAQATLEQARQINQKTPSALSITNLQTSPL